MNRLDKQSTLTFLRVWATLAGLVTDPRRRTCTYVRLSAETHTRIDPLVVISRGTHIVALARIAMGDGTMIGGYTSIRDANQRVGMGDPLRTSGHDALPIDVGRHVWIARSVTLLPGMTIDDGAVIGANAVVIRNVAEGNIVVGVPAKPLPGRRSK